MSAELEGLRGQIRSLQKVVYDLRDQVTARIGTHDARLQQVERRLGIVPQAPLPATPQPAAPAAAGVPAGARPVVPRTKLHVPVAVPVQRQAVAAPASAPAPAPTAAQHMAATGVQAVGGAGRRAGVALGHSPLFTPLEQKALMQELLGGIVQGVTELATSLMSGFAGAAPPGAPESGAAPAPALSAPVPAAPASAAPAPAAPSAPAAPESDHTWMAEELGAENVPPVVTEVTTSSVSH